MAEERDCAAETRAEPGMVEAIARSVLAAAVALDVTMTSRALIAVIAVCTAACPEKDFVVVRNRAPAVLAAAANARMADSPVESAACVDALELREMPDARITADDAAIDAASVCSRDLIADSVVAGLVSTVRTTPMPL